MTVDHLKPLEYLPLSAQFVIACTIQWLYNNFIINI
jgi:hypothetical protein